MTSRKGGAINKLGASNLKRPSAPPVYRPQPVPKVLQTKTSSVALPQAGQPPLPRVPTVFRPEAKKIIQPRTILPPRKSPIAPPVYRPHRLAVQPKLACQGVIQRAISAMDDETLIDLSDMHAVGKAKAKKDQLTVDEIQQMKDGTYLLTKFSGAVGCNCFGWALGEDRDTGDKGKIYNWKKEHGGEPNFTDPDSASAKIILWGDKEGQGEDNWDVLHASVKLSHAELLARSGRFKGLKITKKELQKSGIPDPFWSSAGGMGFGIFVHPRNWFEGGDFGVALKGMKAAK